MTIQDLIANDWIDWARPTDQDADEFYQVEIRLSRDPDRSASTAFAFWGNVGAGTPWRRTWRWRSSRNLDHELKQLSLQIAADQDSAAKEPVVRTYKHITRTLRPSGGWVLDAVADDGTAWFWSGNEWCPHSPLPQPDQPED